LSDFSAFFRKSKGTTMKSLLPIVLLAITLSIPSAYAATPQQQNNIPFITGGIGDEERTAIEAVKKEYNLYATSAGTSGEFTGDMHIMLLDKDGKPLLETDAGPLFYAKLPDGQYTVDGTWKKQTKSEKFTISHGKPHTVHFSWK
jgi:hypothetical protein